MKTLMLWLILFAAGVAVREFLGHIVIKFGKRKVRLVSLLFCVWLVVVLSIYVFYVLPS